MASCEESEDLESEMWDYYHEIFFKSYKDALQEYYRLVNLFKDVAWYNFETKARHWEPPWPPTLQQSFVKLEGACFKRYSTRRGVREAASFPVYYQGAVEFAPELPPEIVLSELKAAYEYCEQCEKQCSAPYEWAPGGNEYNLMLRTSPGVAAFSQNLINNT